MSFSSTTFVFSPCSYGIKICKLKPMMAVGCRLSVRGVFAGVFPRVKRNPSLLIAALPSKTKNGSRDCKSIQYLNLTFGTLRCVCEKPVRSVSGSREASWIRRARLGTLASEGTLKKYAERETPYQKTPRVFATKKIYCNYL